MNSNQLLAAGGYACMIFLWLHQLLAIFILGGLILYVLNKGMDYVTFHFRQAFGLWLIGLILSPFHEILPRSVTSFILIAIIALSVYGIYNCYRNLKIPMPLLGVYFNKYFHLIK